MLSLDKFIKKILLKILIAGIVVIVFIPFLGIIDLVATEGIPYKEILNIRRMYLLLKSVLLSLSVAFISLFISFNGLMYITKKLKKYAFLIIGGIFTLFIISPYIHALSWIKIFGIGSFSFLKTLLVLSTYYSTINILILSVGFYNIDKSYIDSGRIYKKDGSVIYKIIFKMLKPYWISSSALIFILVMSDFSIPSLFQLKTYSLEIFTYYTSGTSFSQIIYISLPLVILNLAALIILINFSKKMEFKKRGVNLFSNFNLDFNLFYKVTTYMSAFVLLVMFLVIFLNFIYSANLNLVYETLISNTDEIKYSLKAALIPSLLSVIIVFILEKYSSNKGVQIFLIIPILISGSLLGIALINFFSRFNIYSSLITSNTLLYYANTFKALPFVYFVLKGTLETKDQNLLNSGLIYEKSWFRRLIRIEIPYYIFPLLSGFYVGFGFLTGEIASSILLIPPGEQLISLKIYSYLHYGSSGKISALGLIIIFFFSIITICLGLIINRKRRYIR